MRIPFISLIAAGALTLGGCAYGDLGYGIGAGYGDSYGYGYGSPYGYSYGSPYYGMGYSSYASPYFGWYDNSYYPGTGYYVYDQYRRPHRWSDRERSYWQSRQQALNPSGTTTTTVRTNTQPNWSGFRTRSTASTSSSADQTSISTDTTTTRHHGRRH